MIFYGGMKINYHNRQFAGIVNSPNGQVSGDTKFHYQQRGNILHATYQGGSILMGQMLGRVNEDNSLYFTYHHFDINHQLKSGCCYSRPKLLPDERIQLHESWEWTHGGAGEGESIVEEIK
jgi:hypothetical protein